VRDNALEETIDPIKEAFLNMVEDGADSIKLDSLLDVFEEMGTTGLNRSVMETVYAKVMEESLILEFTWEDRIEGGKDGTEKGKAPLGKGAFTAKMIQLLDDINFKDDHSRRLYEDRLVFRDKNANMITEYYKNEHSKDGASELLPINPKEKQRQLKYGPQEVWKWLNDAREPTGKHFPKSKFPIKVYFEKPLLQTKETQDAMAKREVTLEMFRQLVSYGQDENTFEDLLQDGKKPGDYGADFNNAPSSIESI
jgi:hypothetical protein